MKKSVLFASGIATVALGFAATPTLAQQSTTQAKPGFIDYMGAQLAISDVDGFDNGLALILNGGKELKSVEGLALEGEFTTTISKPEADIGGVSAEVSYWTLAGYGVYSFPVSQEVAVRGKLGALYESVDIDATGVSDDTDDEFGLSLGFGATFRMTQKMNLIAEYTRIEEDINHISAGVQFRF